MPPRLSALLVGAILLALLALASCSPGVRVARHYRRYMARIQVLEEGRDYQGWSPRRAACQQRPLYPTPKPLPYAPAPTATHR